MSRFSTCQTKKTLLWAKRALAPHVFEETRFRRASMRRWPILAKRPRRPPEFGSAKSNVEETWGKKHGIHSIWCLLLHVCHEHHKKIHFVGHVSEIFGIFWRFSPFWILFVFFEGFDPGGKIQPRHNPRHQRCLHPSHLCVQSWWPRRTQICSCWQFAETHLWFSQEPEFGNHKNAGVKMTWFCYFHWNPQQNFQPTMAKRWKQTVASAESNTRSLLKSRKSNI